MRLYLWFKFFTISEVASFMIPEGAAIAAANAPLRLVKVFLIIEMRLCFRAKFCCFNPNGNWTFFNVLFRFWGWAFLLFRASVFGAFPDSLLEQKKLVF